MSPQDEEATFSLVLTSLRQLGSCFPLHSIQRLWIDQHRLFSHILPLFFNHADDSLSLLIQEEQGCVYVAVYLDTECAS